MNTVQRIKAFVIENKSVEWEDEWMWRVRGERVMSKRGPKFKELRVWQKGKALAVYIYQIPIKIFKHKNKLNFGDKYGNKSKSEI